MLPTKGYFQDIDCPYYNSQCGRPYCHFRHKKKQQDTGNDSPKNCEVPTYKPTPKSQLLNNRSHIPISYVPDLAFRPERTTRNIQKLNFDKPTYKPTPLSLLSSVSKEQVETSAKAEFGDGQEQTDEPKPTASYVEYNPINESKNSTIEYTPDDKSQLSGEESANEYKPVGEGGSHLQYNPTPNSDEVVQDKLDTHYVPSSENQSNIEYHPTINHKTSEYNSAAIDFEDFSNEFEMIDEIISDDNINLEKGHLTDNVESVSSDHYDEKVVRTSSKRPSSKSADKLDSKIKHTKTTHSKTKLLPVKSSSQHSKDNLPIKHSKSNSLDTNDKKSKHLDKNKEKDKSGSKVSHKSKQETTDNSKKDSSNKNKEKVRDVKHKKESKEKSRSTSLSHKRHKSKHKSHDRGKEKEKVTDNSKDRKNKDKYESKDKKREKGHKSLEKDHKSAAKPENDKCKNKKESHNKVIAESEESRLSSRSNSSPLDNIDIDIDMDDDYDETLQECYRIFNEYKPEETVSVSEHATVTEEKTEKKESKLFTGKKRIAHTNAEKITPKIQVPPTQTLPTAAQAMTNRFKVARMAQANNEQNNIMLEVKHMSLKRPAPPSLMAAMKNYKIQKTLKDAQTHNKPSTSLVDQIIYSSQKANSVVAKFSQRKIAPVSNVLSFQKAKERIDEIKQRVADTSKKTIAQTVKGGKRMAHIPEFSLSDIPDVLHAEKSKLPVNVRTRFLTMIAEECGKLYLTKEDAYTRALNEEFNCYEKCKVLITYKNSSMLAVNRIRKEHQEREKQGLGPIYSGEDSTKDKASEFKGKKFYENIKHYMLTDEELDVHCYPKESKVPGKAIMKNKKPTASLHLDEYQRKCARCSKIYVVDEDGFAFYEEECLYHPLKKRTLRGEQTYLCCKSNDETGCVASHTHVSESVEESELEGYQTTMKPEKENDPRSFAVFALDCEMCYTTKGLELTRVSVVDSECKTVYETFVKPLNPIIDYNTRFSGITKQQMDRTSTSILQVQANILHLCNSKTILVGHSLESDMKALKIVHGSVIDTSVLFPHRLGLPHKRALRALASEYLEKIIQNDISGHDSAEDSITCMELVKWKLKEELKVRGIK